MLILLNIFYRLSSGRLNSLGGNLRSSAIGGVTRCNVSLKGNCVKILTATRGQKLHTDSFQINFTACYTPNYIGAEVTSETVQMTTWQLIFISSLFIYLFILLFFFLSS